MELSTFRDDNNIPYDRLYQEISKMIKQNYFELPGSVTVEKRNWVDLILRQLMLRSNDDLHVIQNVLNMAIEMEKNEILDGISFLGLVEIAMDVSSLENCKKIFDILLSNHMKIITKDLNPSKGKGLVLLRVCNELLRRFSSSSDHTFCGKVRMLLSNVFPLSERSGLNLRGSFNTENVTLYEDDGSKANDFYNTFWSCQAYFSNPTATMSDKTTFSRVKDSITLLIEEMEKAVQERIELKLSDDKFGSSASSGSSAGYMPYFPKYLTSRNLFKLQLNDSTFQKTILLQLLIYLTFCSSYLSSEKVSKLPGMKDFSGWTAASESKVTEILEQTGFPITLIKSLLEREGFWVEWKKNGCAKFELDSCDISKSDRIPSATQIQIDGHMGDKELSRLWEKNMVNLESAKDLHIPSLTEFLEPLKEQLDPENQIEKEFRLSNDITYVWRAGRIIVKKGPIELDQTDIIRNEILDVEYLVDYLNNAREKNDSPVGFLESIDFQQMIKDSTTEDKESVPAEGNNSSENPINEEDLNSKNENDVDKIADPMERGETSKKASLDANEIGDSETCEANVDLSDKSAEADPSSEAMDETE